MVRLIMLFLPVLFPSWRFFAKIGAAPRVDFRLNGGSWQCATAPCGHDTLAASIVRLFWNRNGNERLFLVTCAERLLTGNSTKDEEHLLRCLSRRVAQSGQLTVRIRLVDQDGEETAYVSRPFDI